MGTSDAFKVLKIALACGSCNLKTLKALRLNTYHEMHERSFDFFVYNILNKIIKESIFGTYFSVKHLHFCIEIFGLVLLHFRIEFHLPIIPRHSTTFVLIKSWFCFLHLVSVGQQLFCRTRQTRFQPFCFLYLDFVLPL